jgi:hypothetical protein
MRRQNKLYDILLFLTVPFYDLLWNVLKYFRIQNATEHLESLEHKH